MSQTLTTHIRLDDRGVAWIDDTNVKVIEVALDRIAHGSSPEEICDQHDGYLSMSQIHAALMHYYDHQSEFDAESTGSSPTTSSVATSRWILPAVGACVR